MDTTIPQQAVPEGRQAGITREELAACIARAIPEDGATKVWGGLTLRRASSPTGPAYGVSAPCFCVIADGSKEVRLGGDHFRYDPANYLIATAELPVVSQVTEASPERPYLSLRLDLDPALVGSVMVEVGHLMRPNHSDVRAINVSPLDAGLLEAVVRLVRLLDHPADVRFLAPLVTREIIYRLLMGEQGSRLQHLAGLGGSTHRIAPAIERLRKHFDQPLRMEEIARELGMSVSSFHHHFRAVTALSPLQFQKQLRLQEARRLMLGEGFDAATAGYRVGYDDGSHFNREYKRLFGAPPMRDVARLRETIIESASI